MTHQQPIHPQSLIFLLDSVGFKKIDIEYASEVEIELQLKLLKNEIFPEPINELMMHLNNNIKKINEFLYGYQDYYVVAYK